MEFFFEDKNDLFEVYRSRNLDFEPHLHDYVELGFVFSGSALLKTENRDFELKQNDLFCVFPNIIHSYENSEEVDAEMVIFSAELFNEYEKIFRDFVPEVPVINKYMDYARDLFSMLGNKAFRLPHDAQKGIIMAIMGIMIESLELKKQDCCLMSTIKSILIFCDCHYDEPITISDVAEKLNLSRSHIAHTMRNKLGVSFSQYLNKKRLKKACLLLENTDRSIIDIAFATGFNSVRTFNRIFVNEMNCSPRVYRNHHCKATLVIG